MASTIQHLSDEQLVATLTRLCEHERSATVALIAHLAEFDARRLHLGHGFSSLFAYCTGALRLSEHAAYNRIDAARVARRFPLVLERLASGAVTLTSVRLLAPHFTLENHVELLTRAAGKSRLEVEELVAECFPKPPVAASMRKLPARGATPGSATEEAQQAKGLFVHPDGAQGRPSSSTDSVGVEASVLSAASVELSASPVVEQRVPRRAVVAPLSSDTYKVTFTARAETWRKLRQAQELLRHQVPEGDLAQVIDRALDTLLEQLSKRKFAAVVSSRPAPARRTTGRGPQGRHVPAAVRREVWQRDGGSCAFVAPSGRRCGERAFLEFHHVTPYAVDGAPTTVNISLRCRSHNGHEAELYFGSSRRFAALGPVGARQPT